MKKADMSEQAILRRLKTVDQLREICLSLMKAKKESDEKKKDFKKRENSRPRNKAPGSD